MSLSLCQMYLVKLCFSDILLPINFSKFAVLQTNAIDVKVLFQRTFQPLGSISLWPTASIIDLHNVEGFLLFLLNICIYGGFVYFFFYIDQFSDCLFFKIL